MQGERLLNLKEVMRKTGMGRSTIYRRMNQSDFPCPVRIGPTMVRWRESDIEGWIASLPSPKIAMDHDRCA